MSHNSHEPGGQYIPEINIGDKQAWIAMYSYQAEADAELLRVMQEGDGIMDELKEMAIGLQLETDFSKDTNNAEGLMAMSNPAIETANKMLAYQKIAIAARDEVGTIYGIVGLKEWELGTELEPIFPAEYVTRAIGEPNPMLTKRYRQIRAQIEVQRQLSQETRPDVTLGPSTGEPWLVTASVNTARNIQVLQVAQILLSADPAATAQGYAKEAIIERLGLPPAIKPEELPELLEKNEPGSWFYEAVKICREIEPPHNGLAIDKA